MTVLKQGILIVGMIAMKVSSAEIVKGLHYLDGQPAAIEIHEGRVVNVQRLETGERLPLIAPGLIDNQVNGFAGVSFGFSGGNLDRDGVLKATQALWAKGVTTFLPTLTTNSRKALLQNLATLAACKDDPALHGSIAGFHLEGPYISPEDGYRGAHPRAYVRPPDWREFMALYEAAGRHILTVTLAPELPGAQEMIRNLTAMGIVAALGHHNASKAEIDQAVRNGAQIATHLGNGCANTLNRHVNPLWPQLADDGLMISLICDGFHLREEQIRVFYKVKGPERTILTSDVTHFAGLPPGEYRTPEGETIELTAEGLLRYPAQNVLYGSASPLSVGVVHIMRVTGCTLGEAIRMASSNPAALYGLTDRGTIEPGKRADLILFTLGERELIIEKTYVAGELVYQAHP